MVCKGTALVLVCRPLFAGWVAGRYWLAAKASFACCGTVFGSGWGSLPLSTHYASCFILVLLQVWFGWPLSIAAMDPTNLGEVLSPHAWATDVVFSVAALLSQWRVLDGVYPSSTLLWCRVGLLVMICRWFPKFACYGDLPATGHCLGCA
jgi:hypothetical protein